MIARARLVALSLLLMSCRTEPVHISEAQSIADLPECSAWRWRVVSQAGDAEHTLQLAGVHDRGALLLVFDHGSLHASVPALDGAQISADRSASSVCLSGEPEGLPPCLSAAVRSRACLSL